MKKTKYLLITAALLGFGFASAQSVTEEAQQSEAVAQIDNLSGPATKESIERLLQLSGMEKNFGLMHTQFDRMTDTIMLQMGISEAERPIFNKYAKEINDLLVAEINWNRVKTSVIQSYSDSFSEAEVQGLIKFYESDIGKAFVNKMPKITKESLDISQRLMTSIMPRVQVIIQKLDDELTQKRNQ